jgi:signal transduction histidine kinase
MTGPPRSPTLDPVFRTLRTHGELTLAAGLAVAAQAELWLSDARVEDRRLLAPIALALCALLFLRVRAPLVALAGGLAGSALTNVVTTSGTDDPIVVVIVLLVLVYSVGAHTTGTAAWLGGALVLVAVLAALAQDSDEADVGGFIFFLLVIGGPWVAGRAIQHRRLREDVLIVEREERARAAVGEERARIARELHDVVSHAISVVVLQARGGRKALVDRPEEARGAFDEIERTSSQALAEMRRLLGMLRAEDEQIALAPQPSLAHLEALVANVREAGLPVELRVEGEPVELPPGVDLSAYRIVQEALTNALKHAGPAQARVLVRYDAGGVEVEVADDGTGSANGAGGGHGLVGMQERVAVYGGELESGPRPGGGFAVRARLPL